MFHVTLPLRSSYLLSPPSPFPPHDPLHLSFFLCLLSPFVPFSSSFDWMQAASSVSGSSNSASRRARNRTLSGLSRNPLGALLGPPRPFAKDRERVPRGPQEGPNRAPAICNGRCASSGSSWGPLGAILYWNPLRWWSYVAGPTSPRRRRRRTSSAHPSPTPYIAEVRIPNTNRIHRFSD